MANLSRLTVLDFDYYETAKQTIIESQVNEKLIIFKQDALLPCDERKTVAEFKQELLQVCYQRGLDILFIIRRFTF